MSFEVVSVLKDVRLWVSLARDAVHKRGPCRRAVSLCLSGRMSVCRVRFVYCVETAKDTVIVAMEYE